MRELVANAKRGLAVLLAVATVMTGSGITVSAEELSTNESGVFAEDYAKSIEAGASDEHRESGGAADAEEVQVSLEQKEGAEVSPADGQETETEPEEVTGEDTSESQVVTGLDGVTYDTKVMKSSMNKKGWIKVSYKLKGAKYFQLDRLSADGTADPTHIFTKTNKKKAFTDKTACLGENTSYIYVMTAYDKNGQEMGRYATVPAPLMLQGQTVEDNTAVELMFMRLKGEVSYIIERSDLNKKNFRRVGVIDASGLTNSDVKVSYYNGDEVKGAKFEYVRFIDRSGGIVYGNKYYYRVRACVSDRDMDIGAVSETDLRVVSLNSKAILARAGLPQPEIISITGPHADGGTCYKEGEICFTAPKGIGMDDSRLKYYEIYRSTKKDTKFKRIKKIKADAEETAYTVKRNVTALDGSLVDAYVVKYNKFPPYNPENHTESDVDGYYYKVRAVGQKSIKGSFSELYHHSTRFAPVEELRVDPVNQKTLKVTWKSEKCATKYEIYRSNPLSVSPLDGDSITTYKRIATVANKPTSAGTVSYKDSKGLTGKFYCYRIRPVNGKEKGNYTEWVCGATKVMGPTKVTADGISPTRIDVTWNASFKPSSYILQRRTTALNGGEWVTLKEFKSDSTEFKNRKYSDKNSSTNPIEMGIAYYYRVLSRAKINGQLETSDPDMAVVAEGYARPKAPSSFKITLLTSDGNWTGNKVSWKKLDIDHITEYVLERKTGKNEWKEVKRFPSGSSSYKYEFYDDDNRGTHYYYRVYGVYEDGSGKKIEGRSANEDILMPSKLHLESESLTVNAGQTFKVKIGGFTPKETTFKDIVFTNSNTSIIKAKSSGTDNGNAYVEFTALKKGKVTVKAKPKYYTGSSDNLVKKCEITVR